MTSSTNTKVSVTTKDKKSTEMTDDQKYSHMQKAKQQLIDLFSAAEKGNCSELAKQIDSHVPYYAKEENILLNESDTNYNKMLNRVRIGIVLSFLDGRKRNALHFASLSGKTECVKYLVKMATEVSNEIKEDFNGNLVDSQDIDGATPLMLSINSGAADTAQLLIDMGADPSVPNTDGATALHAASGMGFTDIVKSVAAHDLCDINAVSTIGTPLHWATGRGHADVAEILLKLGSDVNMLNPSNVPPLVMAAARNSLLTVQVLLQGGADLCITAPNHVSALTIIADAGNFRLMEVVLANVSEEKLLKACSMTDGEGLVPIEVAQWSKHEKIVKMLLPISPKIITGGSIEGIARHVQEKKDIKTKKAAAVAAAAEAEKNWTPSTDQVRIATESKVAGNRFFIKKEFENAIKCYSEGIEANPKHAQLLSNRAMCYIGINQPEKALIDAKKAIKESPGWNKAYYRAGQCYMALKQYPDAAQILWKGYTLDTGAKGAKTLQKLFKEAVALGKRIHQGKTAVAKEEEGHDNEDGKDSKTLEKYDHVIPVEVPEGKLSSGKFITLDLSFNNVDNAVERAGQFVDNYKLDRSLIHIVARQIAKVQAEANL